jgi:hypothetical protein
LLTRSLISLGVSEREPSRIIVFREPRSGHKGEIQGLLEALHKVVHLPADLNDLSFRRFGNSRNMKVPNLTYLSLNC